MEPSYLFLDVETTGLDPKLHTILSIGAIYEAGHIHLEYYAKIRPTVSDWAHATEEALKVNGHTHKELTHARSLSTVYYEMLFWVMLATNGSEDSFYLVGQNPKFDLGFLQACMPKIYDLVSKRVKDIREMYSQRESKGLVPTLPKRSGALIAEALHVNPEPEPHNALEGARVVYRNFYALISLGEKKEWSIGGRSL